jgi:hypothetical protein
LVPIKLISNIIANKNRTVNTAPLATTGSLRLTPPLKSSPTCETRDDLQY